MTALSPPPSGTLPSRCRSRCRPRPRRERREAGSAAVELTLLAPLLILLLLLVVAAGRQVQARLLVDAAARQAARAATAARSPVQAARAADSTARAAVAGHPAACQTVTVTLDTGGFTPGGTVTVTVSCTVGLSDLTGLGLPGTTTITGRAASPLDLYRADPRGFANSEASTGGNPSGGAG